MSTNQSELDQLLESMANDPTIFSSLPPAQQSIVLAGLSEKSKMTKESDKVLKDREAIIFKKEEQELLKGIEKVEQIKNTAVESLVDPKKPDEEVKAQQALLTKHYDTIINNAKTGRDINELSRQVEVGQLIYSHSRTLKASVEEKEAKIIELQKTMNQDATKRTLQDSFATKGIQSIVEQDSAKKQKVESPSPPNSSRVSEIYTNLEKSFKNNGGLNPTIRNAGITMVKENVKMYQNRT
jgi:hypothetical protein